MNATHMRNMADEELLNHLDSQRNQSPVIGELCRRVEALLVREPVEARHECPVCLADLEATYFEADGSLNLSVRT